MANLLFAGNDLSAYAGVGSGTTYETTTQNARDPVYADGEIKVKNASQAFAFFNEPVTLGQDVWVHFTAFWGDTVSVYNSSRWTNMMLCMYDASNPSARPLGIRFSENDTPNGRAQRIFSGTDLAGSFIEVGNAYTYTTNTRMTVDVHMTLDPILGKCLVYYDGVLVMAYYGDTTLSGQVTQWDGFFHAAPVPAAGWDDFMFFTEGLASRVSTLGQRVALLRPTADGDRAEWQGTFDNVNDTVPNDGTSISSDTPDAVHLLTMADLHTNIPADVTIAGLVSTVRGANNGLGTVTGLSHMVKVGVTEFEGLPKTLGATVDANQEVWEQNPATSAPWTVADIAAVQVGVKAKV